MASVLTLSARGASFLILIQVCSRALTFIINQLLLRYSTPELLGISTQLELFTISVLYFSRESLRVALQRPTSNTQAAINVAYIPIALSLPLIFAIGSISFRSSSLLDVPYMTETLGICSLATIIELASEPCFAVVQQKLLYSKRAAAEASAAVSRAVFTYATVIWYHRSNHDVGVLPFALGLLAYSVTLSVVYISQMIPVARRDNFSLWPKRISEPAGRATEYIASYFSRTLGILGLNLYLQSGVKYILTQGDSLLITSLSSLHDQGTYALATNYGGLIARVLFQPIEESSRNLFAKLCVSTTSERETSSPGIGPILDNNQGQNKSNDTGSIEQAASILKTILRLYSVLALLAWTLGPHLAPHLLRLLAGSQWSSTNATEVLSTYTYYIPILAINGVTEAFVSAVATNAELRRQSFFLGLNFLVFALSGWYFVRQLQLGSAGLVWACCVGLGCRCAWNGVYITSFFQSKGVQFLVLDAAPNILSVACAVAVGARLSVGGYGFHIVQDATWDDLLGIAGYAAILVAALLVFERHFWIDCYHMIVPSTKQRKATKAE